jgi:predicted RNA-binding Zn-ribbon protein involved in translation (DUF1610 family)
MNDGEEKPSQKPARLPITTVIFCCPKCGLSYKATQKREDRAGRFKCMKCSAGVYSWTGAYNYVIWTPINRRILKRNKL